MQDLLLVAAVAATFVFGWFLVKKLEDFVKTVAGNRGRRRMKKAMPKGGRCFSARKMLMFLLKCIIIK